MDAEDVPEESFLRNAALSDGVLNMVVPLAVAGDELERSELEVFGRCDDGGWR